MTYRKDRRPDGANHVSAIPLPLDVAVMLLGRSPGGGGAIDNLPSLNDPSHESVPVYVADVPCATLATVPFMRRLQIGVGSETPPAGKTS